MLGDGTDDFVQAVSASRPLSFHLDPHRDRQRDRFCHVAVKQALASGEQTGAFDQGIRLRERSVR